MFPDKPGTRVVSDVGAGAPNFTGKATDLKSRLTSFGWTRMLSVVTEIISSTLIH